MTVRLTPGAMPGPALNWDTPTCPPELLPAAHRDTWAALTLLPGCLNPRVPSGRSCSVGFGGKTRPRTYAIYPSMLEESKRTRALDYLLATHNGPSTALRLRAPGELVRRLQPPRTRPRTSRAPQAALLPAAGLTWEPKNPDYASGAFVMGTAPLPRRRSARGGV